MNDIIYNDSLIKSLRGSKNNVDHHLPYGWLIEKERTRSGTIEDTGIIFLTNRECPFHCLMCDLWKNTTDYTVSQGAIPQQIAWALQKMPGIKNLKLYNSGSFFDPNAVPEEDYKAIARLLEGFETVIVESHTKFIGEKCLRLRDMLKGRLNVAIGLESVQPGMLAKLNKKMTTEDFSRSVHFLNENGIDTRAFILLRPPFVSEEEGIYWAERSIDFAFESGTGCCTVIPVRGGNGIMEQLKIKGEYVPPRIKSLETVLEYGISLNAGRVFGDTWDLRLFSDCDACLENRISRINEMNLSQKIQIPVECHCNKL